MSNEIQIREPREVRLPDEYGNLSRLYYSRYTSPEIVGIIENLNSQYIGEEKARLRLFYGDTDTPDFEQIHGRKPDPGHCWDDEFDVVGRLGNSMGPIKIPILLNNNRSHYGGGILTSCIVRLFADRREVYRHPNYHSDFDSASVQVSELTPEYSHAVVTVQGEVARFHSERSAINYLAFMRGERFSK